MAIKDALLPEFDEEMKTTRTLLERVPDAKAAWKPHPKSMSLGELAIHLATMAGWTMPTLTQTHMDFAADFTPPVFGSTAEALKVFDQAVAKARATIAATSDADFMVPWTLRRGDHVFFTLPRVVVLRSMVLNHAIHHRGQLSVYLRLNDVPLPSIYGPTADTH
jgi:uncharacterized damage-inducible protein DinB